MVEARELLTSAVISERLAAVLDSKFDPREWRLSESGGCQRKRVLRVLGYEADEFSEETAGYFERGNILERWLVEQFERQLPGQVATQVEVIGPGCLGHMDIFMPTQPLIVEVKTANESAEQFGLPKAEHLMQVQSYLHFGRKNGVRVPGQPEPIVLPDDTRAEIVYFLLGRHLRHVAFPVEYNPAVGEEIERNLLTLQEMAGREEVPDVPAEYDAGRFPCSWRHGEVTCPFYRHCWSEVATEPAPAVDDADAARLFAEYREAKARYTTANDEADTLKQQVRFLEDHLADIFAGRQVDKGALQAGGVQISRSPVAGRVTYNMEGAALAGAVDLARLEQFRQIGAGYTRWTVKATK